MNETAGTNPSAATGTDLGLNPFFSRLSIGLAIPFALWNGMFAFVAHALPNPLTYGTVLFGQISSFLGTLLILSLGLAAFHRTQSKFYKIGGGFLIAGGLGMLLMVCMTLVE